MGEIVQANIQHLLRPLQTPSVALVGKAKRLMAGLFVSQNDRQQLRIATASVPRFKLTTDRGHGVREVAPWASCRIVRSHTGANCLSCGIQDQLTCDVSGTLWAKPQSSSVCSLLRKPHRANQWNSGPATWTLALDCASPEVAKTRLSRIFSRVDVLQNCPRSHINPSPPLLQFLNKTRIQCWHDFNQHTIDHGGDRVQVVCSYLAATSESLQWYCTASRERINHKRPGVTFAAKSVVCSSHKSPTRLQVG